MLLKIGKKNKNFRAPLLKQKIMPSTRAPPRAPTFCPNNQHLHRTAQKAVLAFLTEVPPSQTTDHFSPEELHSPQHRLSKPEFSF